MTIYACFLAALIITPEKTQTLYNSLDPKSIAEHLAFYELYPNTKEGGQALEHVWTLLSENHTSSKNLPFPDNFDKTIHYMVNLVNRQKDADIPCLSEEELALFQKIANRLPNRKLRGYNVSQEKEVLDLAPEEIDLARAVFLSQLGHDKEAWQKIWSYEAMLDLMAFQILANLPKMATAEEKIEAMNHFIFEVMRFKFPPHSLYAKDIDLYTFLPSVLDSRKGVCLGVSILYLCLAQRLDVKLEMITPPGHIYVRYHEGDKMINIETTARGIHIDSKEYLGIDTKSLQERTIKEVIGLAHFNQASSYIQDKKFDKALESYQKAQSYLPDDMLLKELMGYTYLFLGKLDEGKKLLVQVKDHIPEFSISPNLLAADYLEGKTDSDGILMIFQRVDSDRESVIAKRDQLQKKLEEYPNFQTGWFQLAVTWLQLHRQKEALEILEKCHVMNPIDPTLEYYLSVLHLTRLNYPKAWQHLKQAEKIVQKKNYSPKPLEELRRELILKCPEMP